MNFVIPSFAPAAPEIVLLVLTSILLIMDTIWTKRFKFATYYATQAILTITALLILFSFTTEEVLTFHGSFIRDNFADVMKLFILLITMGVFLFSREYLQQKNFFRGEYFVLGLFSVLGMFVMVSANNLITMFIGLEIMSLSVYTMIAMRKDHQAALEASMKYFVLGALATGMMLYGFSMIYGATGSVQFDVIASVIASGKVDDVILSFGLVFVVIGLAFKLGAVPFHMWVPDVYHGAPSAVTLFIGTAPKLATFVMLYRVLIDGLEGLSAEWQTLLIMLAVSSLVVGAFVAIVQKNLKRMLAYSGIGHVGFILLGIIAANQDGYSAAMFYTIVYSITAVAGFGMIVVLSRMGSSFDNIVDFKGLNARNPWLALMFLFVMFSMAGIPPFIGFYAKIVVLEEVINSGFIWLAVFAVVTSVISTYYYLMVVKVMYFDEPDETSKAEPVTRQLNVAISFVAISLLVLGIMPSGLIDLAYNSL